MVGGLIFLVLLTLLSLSMFRGGSLQERLAGNTREKQRALETAQSALQYGEWWLTSAHNLGQAPTKCEGTAPVDGNDPANVKICTTLTGMDVTDPKTWYRTTYTPATLVVNPEGGRQKETKSDTRRDVNYAATPWFNITFLGNSGVFQLYRVTGFGYGGNADTVAVVQSVFRLQPAFGAPPTSPTISP